MVENSGKAPSAYTIRPLNLPCPISVDVDGSKPITITLNHQKHKIILIDDMWEITDEWWRQHPISRSYYKCILKEELPMIIYHDILTNTWYRQKE